MSLANCSFRTSLPLVKFFTEVGFLTNMFSWAALVTKLPTWAGWGGDGPSLAAEVWEGGSLLQLEPSLLSPWCPNAAPAGVDEQDALLADQLQRLEGCNKSAQPLSEVFCSRDPGLNLGQCCEVPEGWWWHRRGGLDCGGLSGQVPEQSWGGREVSQLICLKISHPPREKEDLKIVWRGVLDDWCVNEPIGSSKGALFHKRHKVEGPSGWKMIEKVLDMSED